MKLFDYICYAVIAIAVWYAGYEVNWHRIRVDSHISRMVAGDTK
jgi:hypothetical protein